MALSPTLESTHKASYPGPDDQHIDSRERMTGGKSRRVNVSINFVLSIQYPAFWIKLVFVACHIVTKK
jgi:hypothetical protein